jgi:protein-L-isoaspartate(D-aspartate) O-methyltransferase
MSILMRSPVRLLAASCLLIGLACCTSASEKDSSQLPDRNSEFAKARQKMIQSQLVRRGISDKKLLAAFEKVERHKFVPRDLRSLAYEDHPLPIGEDQTISQPYIVALMTEVLDLRKNDKVLEIGTGSGYQAAILAELVEQVYTVEIIDTLGRKAKKLLNELDYGNIEVRIGDGFRGWPEHAPFDAIIVTCAPAKVPQPLMDQLAEGGRLVIPVGVEWQELILLKKKDGIISRETIAPVRFVPMTGESEKK